MAKIFVIDQGTLYSTDENGAYTELTSGWADSQCMTAFNGAVYIIHNGTLYKVNPDNGEYKELTGGWGNTRAMVGVAGKLYMIDGSTMYSADPETGAYTELTGGWNNPYCVTAI